MIVSGAAHTELFIKTAEREEVKELAERLGVVNKDHSLDDFLALLHRLIGVCRT